MSAFEATPPPPSRPTKERKTRRTRRVPPEPVPLPSPILAPQPILPPQVPRVNSPVVPPTPNVSPAPTELPELPLPESSAPRSLTAIRLFPKPAPVALHPSALIDAGPLPSFADFLSSVEQMAKENPPNTTRVQPIRADKKDRCASDIIDCQRAYSIVCDADPVRNQSATTATMPPPPSDIQRISRFSRDTAVRERRRSSATIRAHVDECDKERIRKRIRDALVFANRRYHIYAKAGYVVHSRDTWAPCPGAPSLRLYEPRPAWTLVPRRPASLTTRLNVAHISLAGQHDRAVCAAPRTKIAPPPVPQSGNGASTNRQNSHLSVTAARERRMSLSALARIVPHSSH